MRILSPQFAAALAVALFGFSASALAQDSIFGAKGTPTKGTVTKTSPTEVTLEIAGVERGFPVNEIRKVTFSGEPNELERAREAVRQGNFNNAQSELKKIDPAASFSDIIKQDIEFYKAFCAVKIALEGTGDKTAAGGGLLKFVNANPGSYHYFEACEALGDILTSLGKNKNAAEYYGKLSAAPWPDYKMRASVYEGRALSASNQHAEALQKFESVLASTINTPEAQAQKQSAAVGKAVCLAYTDKGEEGLKLLDDIIANGDSASDRVLFAKVYNAQGACHLKAGRNKDALLSYLHTHLLFDRDGESHAEALFNLVKLWAEVGKTDRSVAMRKLLTDRYPGSPWATAK